MYSALKAVELCAYGRLDLNDLACGRIANRAAVSASVNRSLVRLLVGKGKDHLSGERFSILPRSGSAVSVASLFGQERHRKLGRHRGAPAAGALDRRAKLLHHKAVAVAMGAANDNIAFGYSTIDDHGVVSVHR